MKKKITKIMRAATVVVVLLSLCIGCATGWFVFDSGNKGTVYWNRQEEKKKKGYIWMDEFYEEEMEKDDG